MVASALQSLYEKTDKVNRRLEGVVGALKDKSGQADMKKTTLAPGIPKMAASALQSLLEKPI